VSNSWTGPYVDCVHPIGGIFDTPLHLAAARGHYSAVLLLLQHGAKFLFNIAEETPLHSAAARGRSDVVRLLLDRGARGDYFDANGHTPFDVAEANNHVEAMALLADSHARALASRNAAGERMERAIAEAVASLDKDRGSLCVASSGH
jgi:ankyrin repeat protein